MSQGDDCRTGHVLAKPEKIKRRNIGATPMTIRRCKRFGCNYIKQQVGSLQGVGQKSKRRWRELGYDDDQT